MFFGRTPASFSCALRLSLPPPNGEASPKFSSPLAHVPAKNPIVADLSLRPDLTGNASQE